jgi:nucleoside-diphosphate-sugar epimerase
MNHMRRILLTGHNGYIGSVMADYFIRAGYAVTGLDTFYYSECTLGPQYRAPKAIRKDIRDLGPDDLRGFDAVVHLAALSNDPVGALAPALTEEINCAASVRLAELARAAGVRRFLFSSSCIMYGMSEAAEVTEESPLDPKTPYARSKAQAEQAIALLAADGFSPTFLRNGTVYGLSPRMRFDTVLNDLVMAAITSGEVVLLSDGKPWRPVVHVEDVAHAFQSVLEAPREAVHNQAFNTGADELNRQMIQLGEIVAAIVPGCRLRVVGESSADQRTYRAQFGKFARAFPDFRFRWTVENGAKDLYLRLTNLKLTRELYGSARFTRLRWLRHLLEAGRLDGTLRWLMATAPDRGMSVARFGF